jgi:hypothetical protein
MIFNALPWGITIRTIIWWVDHLRAILVHTRLLILCFCWRCHHVLQGLPRDVSDILARTPASILWEGRPRKHGLVLVSVCGPDWDLFTMHELHFYLLKSKVSLSRADTAKKRRHFTKWRRLQQIYNKRRQVLQHVLGTWERWLGPRISSKFHRGKTRKCPPTFSNFPPIPSRTYNLRRMSNSIADHWLLDVEPFSLWLMLCISTKKRGLAVVSGAEIESAQADGPRRRRRRRKDIESDLGQLPDAISLLIVVIRDTISLFEALEPAAIS